MSIGTFSAQRSGLTVFVGCGLSHIANDRDHRTTPEYSALLVLLLHGKTHSGLR
jgi:hypothetical protein